MKCSLRFVITEPLLEGASVVHFCFQGYLQEKMPMKRNFFEELKAESGFSILIVGDLFVTSRRMAWNKYYTR